MPPPVPSKPDTTTATTPTHITGVSLHTGSGKWHVSIRLGGQRHSLGYFKTQIDAGKHLFNVLNVLNGMPATNKKAQKYADIVTNKVTVTHEELLMKIKRANDELPALAVPEGSHYKPGF